jgi:hypothetical protein
MTWVTQFLDGFDHYSTADLGAKWNLAQGASTSIDTTIFRNSGRALKIGTGSTAGVFKGLTTARNFCIGFGFYMPALAAGSSVTSGSGEPICSLGESFSFSSAVGQLGLSVLSDGKIRAVRGSHNGQGFTSAVELGVGLTVMSAATWYFVEMRVFIDSSAGQVEVRINGVNEFNLSGINTQHQAFNYASVLAFSGGNSSNTVTRYYDDLYVRSSSSGSAEAGGFLGDIKVKPYYPNADGTYTAMTCSTGSTHNTLVDETTPNTTDYVSSSTALTKDSYGFQDVSETGSIKAVQLSAYCYKLDAGFRGIDVFAKSGATESFATSLPLSTTPKYLTKVWEQDPNTAADWSQANLNAAEFGVRISADL